MNYTDDVDDMRGGLQIVFGKTCENISTTKQIKPRLMHARIHTDTFGGKHQITILVR